MRCPPRQAIPDTECFGYERAARRAVEIYASHPLMHAQYVVALINEPMTAVSG